MCKLKDTGICPTLKVKADFCFWDSPEYFPGPPFRRINSSAVIKMGPFVLKSNWVTLHVYCEIILKLFQNCLSAAWGSRAMAEPAEHEERSSVDTQSKNWTVCWNLFK